MTETPKPYHDSPFPIVGDLVWGLAFSNTSNKHFVLVGTVIKVSIFDGTVTVADSEQFSTIGVPIAGKKFNGSVLNWTADAVCGWVDKDVEFQRFHAYWCATKGFEQSYAERYKRWVDKLHHDCPAR